MAIGNYPERTVGQIGGMVGPADVPSLEADRRMRAQTQGTPFVEVNWDALDRLHGRTPAGQSQPDLARVDPIQMVTSRNDQIINAIQTAGNQQIAIAAQPIQQKMATLAKQYQITQNSIWSQNLQAEQRDARLQQAEATYQKQLVKLQDDLTNTVTPLQQKQAAQLQEARLNAALQTQEVRSYYKMAEDGYIEPWQAQEMSLRAMGINVPVNSMRPEKAANVQNPKERMTFLSQTVSGITQDLEDNFRWAGPKNRELHVIKPRVAWESTDFNPKTDTRPATQDEWQYYMRQQYVRNAARDEMADLRWKTMGLRTPDTLSSVASPVAQGIRQAMPKPQRQYYTSPRQTGSVQPVQSAGPVHISTDAEYDALSSGTEFVGPDGRTRRKP